jgi:hypothetical protein
MWIRTWNIFKNLGIDFQHLQWIWSGRWNSPTLYLSTLPPSYVPSFSPSPPPSQLLSLCPFIYRLSSPAICIDAGDFKMEQYFPGSEYIHWLGMGGMNFGTTEGGNWIMPTNLFQDMTSRMRRITGGKKPIGIHQVLLLSI